MVDPSNRVLEFVALALAEGLTGRPCPVLLDAGLDPIEALSWGLDGAVARGVAPSAALRLSSRELASRARAVVESASAAGAHVLCPADAHYPPALLPLPLRPAVLFCRGDPAALANPERSVAVVGTRTPTPYGSEAARHFAGALAGAGLVIVSGLALGVDYLSHRACVERRVPTVAVLGGGVDVPYPREHLGLMDEIVNGGGAVVSEFPCGRRPHRASFPRRNRLLAGLARAVLVVEAGRKSGSLSTARWAAEYGRSVFAVPGPWSSPQSAGCHELVADGANLAADPESLLEALAVEPGDPISHSANLARSAGDEAILGALAGGPIPFDQAAIESGLDRTAFVLAATHLIAAGRLRRLPGNLLARSS